MASLPVSARLKALVRSYNETLLLIQTLHNSSPASVGEDHRAEIASEIHQSLKEQEDTLEILRQDIEEAPAPSSRRWVGGGSVTLRRESEQDLERERDATTVARLGEDLKNARQAFRRAQLQAKRNADTAKRKERDLLFKRAETTTENRSTGRQPGQESLTQDELAIDAADNVTRALRRTHDLLQGNLEQSQFAQQTLLESSAALEGLTESYSGMDGLLKSSRGLVGQLLRSQKSDTWYLETAFFILCITIGWLVFRRWLYGPGWWLVYQPLRLLWYGIWTTFSTVGITSGQQESIPSLSASESLGSGLNGQGRPTFKAGAPPISMELRAKGGGWNRAAQTQNAAEEGMIEKIGKAFDESTQPIPEDASWNDQKTEEDLDGQDDEQQQQEPSNPKKRMMELEKEQIHMKDEL